MGWILSTVAALIVCSAIFFIGNVLTRESSPGTPGRFRGLIVRAAALVLLVLWVGLGTAIASVRQVEAGHVGVVYQFGEIVGQKSEGLQFIAPWQSMRTASVQVQRKQFDKIESFSAETQEVFITATINYSVSDREIQRLFRDVGPNWFDRLVEARVNNFFKEETVKYGTVDIAPNREKIRTAVLVKLQQDLQPFSVTVRDLLIENIDFSPTFKQSIENKQIATQDALREQERVKQSQFQAQQKVEIARGDAESVKIAADAQASANRALAASLTPEVIQFQAVQKLADNIQIALIPSGQGLIIDPASLLKPIAAR